MKDIVLIVLLMYLIFRDVVREDITSLFMKKEEKQEDKRYKEFKKEFNNMMDYSIEDAIKSKRGGLDGE